MEDLVDGARQLEVSRDELVLDIKPDIKLDVKLDIKMDNAQEKKPDDLPGGGFIMIDEIEL